MDLTLLPISFIAGVLTILAPCILPVLPIIIGSSVGEKSVLRPVIITLSLALSIVVFTLLLKVSTIFIDIPQDFWKYFSGGIILFFAFSLLFPDLYGKLLSKIFSGKLKKKLEKKAFEESKKKSFWSAIILGASLGPIFSACSPTYFIILSTVLPASFGVGVLNLVAFSLGLAIIMFLVAFAGQKVLAKLNLGADPKGWFKRGLGVVFLLVALMIMTGLDKTISTKILEYGFFDVTKIEQKILENK